MAECIQGARRTKRFGLVIAGQRLIFGMLPFREPESRWHLEQFVETVEQCHLSLADIDAVLIRILRVLGDHTDGRLPTLVDRYASSPFTLSDCLGRFSACLLDLLKFRGVTDGLVQQAIHYIDARYRDPKCSPASVARELGVGLSKFDVAFKRAMNVKPGEYIRGVRLDQAALDLLATNKTIKEIWVDVGYNDHSNFDHYFKHRFTVCPSEYRARALRPAVMERYRGGASRRCCETSERGTVNRKGACADSTVLIVDDDDCSRTAVERRLCMEGASVTTVSNGEMGLQVAEHLRPDVILVETRLGGIDGGAGEIDGLEFLRRLRARPGRRTDSGNDLGVVLWTGDWDVFDHANEVKALGAIIQSKPCDLDTLASTIGGLTGELSMHPARVSGASDVRPTA